MQKGTISVQTENIFPIIKKFLYSDQEIFLRELVSNATDATQKLKTLALKGEVQGELGDLTIDVALDKEKNTLTISDCGIGMTQQEVEKYITQIAFSSANEFLEKYKDTDNTSIIGHFGLGFFSAFMVAEKVEIRTQSYKNEESTVLWSCDGSTNYEISEITEKRKRGTDVILYLAKDATEYGEEYRIEELLTKYCRFLPIPIKFGDKENPSFDEEGNKTGATVEPNIINNTQPAWTKKPNELNEQDYLNFYNELYPNSDEPLFWIHLNVDYPFNLTGILYFPRIKNNLEIRKDRIHLYSNQVFVTNHVDNIVPDYLMLLHGVIDSPDIPLNVSRSYLQSDPEVKKINNHIAKKVAEKLQEQFNENRQVFEEKWEHLGILIKYGILSDEKFADRVQSVCLFQNTQNQNFTLEEYKEKIKTEQTDKNNKIVVLYSNDTEKQHAYIEKANQKQFDVIKFDLALDPHFIGYLERKDNTLNFKRVDADTLDHLIEKTEARESVLSDEEQKQVQEVFNKVIGNQLHQVQTKALAPEDNPVTITQSEFMRRMKDMAQMGGAGMDFYRNTPDMLNVVVNTNHPLIAKLKTLDNNNNVAKQLYDLALLQQGMLKGAELTSFINRSLELVK